MKETNLLNIMVVGVGGQGVLTLSNIIRELAKNKSFKCEGASFKGGAQRMGSVYSELRILLEKDSDLTFSSQIPKGKVDVLIGLEPWETLRFSDCCNSKTRVVVNSHIEKLFVERFSLAKQEKPVEGLKKLFKNIIVSDFTKMAKEETGAAKNMNKLMIMELISQEGLPFSNKELELVIDHI